MTKRVVALIVLCAAAAVCQANVGELRLTVTDPSGAAMKCTVLLVSEANQYRASLSTNEQGQLDVQRLPFGIYQILASRQGFAPTSQIIQIRSSLPADTTLRLKLSSEQATVTVTAENTLINPDQAGVVNQIGSATVEHRLSSLPGRSLQDLINQQPGWIYEGNAVLHPRGSEYQTQFDIDGVPLTNNMSPSFGTEISANDVQSMSIYTAGIPAEYGRKLGGVVAINTLRNPQAGFHGEAVLSGGSFDTAGGSGQGEYTWGANTLGFSADGEHTNHYLNPVVTQNYSNTATLGDVSVNFQRDLNASNRVTALIRHELARFDLPNEYVQQQAGQHQTGDNFDTLGIATYQHTFSPNAVGTVRGMLRQSSLDFNSNPESTPIEVFQHNWFREGYLKADLDLHRRHQEWQAGVESDSKALHEDFNYIITDPTQYDASTPLTFAFLGRHPDWEQGAYVQDLIELGNWTINAGVRWDHYQLLVNRQAVSPRLAISRYFPSAAGVVLHFSYDRVFQTPSFENILLSSSTAAAGLDTISLQLPVQPSEGDYYEAGLAKVFREKVKLSANYFVRAVNNYADDNQIDNTTISYPIAFQKALTYGADAALEMPLWGRLSGNASYSYEVAKASFPVTGGLFLGDAASIPASGIIPASQDERNAVRARLRYQVTPRLWLAGGAQFDSGLPFQFTCDPSLTQAQCIQGQVQTYGEAVVSRINFARGRIAPTTLLNASAGADVYKSERMQMSLQLDAENLTNVVDVIDFGGLFSGNAIGPSRSVFLRFATNF